MYFAIISCGIVISQFSIGSTNPIMNGSPVKRVRKHLGSTELIDQTEFPFMVRILIMECFPELECENEGYLCGGTIIRRGAVLTAAHCLTSTTKEPEVYIYAGMSHMEKEINKAQLTAMRDYVIHKEYVDEDWNSDGRVYQRNDIAIIWLEVSMDYDKRVNQAMLSTRHAKIENKIGFALGWGEIRPSEYPEILQKGEMRVMKQSSCVQNLPGITNTEGVFCTLADNKKTMPCLGDSCGPFVIDNRVVGVSSYTAVSYKTLSNGSIIEFCDVQKPAVYTNVGKYERWIADNLLLGGLSDREKITRRSSS